METYSDSAQLEFGELLFSTGRGINTDGPSGRSISVLLIAAAADTGEAVTKILSSMEYLPSCVEVHDREGLEGALATTEFDVILCESSNASTEAVQLLAAVHNEGYEIPILAFTRKNISEVIGRQLGRAVNDVSVRRARRLYAQQLQERFLTLIENSSDAIALMTPNALITYASPSTKRILGYGTSELVGHSGLDLLHPEDRRRAERGLAELMVEPGKTVKTEVRVRHKDGSWRGMEGVSCNLLRNPNVRAIVLNFRDITERKRAEEALRESELRYATLAEAVPSMLYTHLPTGSNDYMSADFYEYTGMLPGTALGHGWNHALHPDDADRCTCLWWQCVREGTLFESEYRLRRFDGAYRWFLGRCVPVRDESGKVVRWFGVCTDIDDRKRAEETLRQSERRFRALIEKSSDGFVLVDKDGIIFYAGPPILGYSADESIGRNSLGLIHHEDRPEMARRLRELFQEPGQNVRGQFRAHHKDGSWRWIEAECKNLIDEPSVGGIVVNYRDVTERKGFEEQLRQTQRLESLGVLAGGIAHDFNNLLAVILGNATLAASTLPPGAPAAGALEDVIRASERATDLTRQMLAFAGKGRFVTRVVDISALVRDIGHLMKSAMPKRALLRWELACDLPAVKADAGQIQQLVMNLLINAAEAIPEHGGNVLVSTSLQEVDEDYLRLKFPGEHLRPGTYVILQVQDSGVGMDENTQSKIFDPFFSTKFKGRGLGLAATLGIVRGHGGAIRVDSAPGQGTTFRVLLPSVAERPEQRPNKTAPTNLTVPGAILVVDDEAPLRNMAREVLLHYGSTVLLAENGQVAVDLFRERADQIALVLLDLTMPVLDGEETLRRLRAIRPEVKVILSSGYNEIETVRKFAGQDLAGFLQKPYSASELAAAVSSVLKRVPL